ncbi:MAG: HypC/HybG/HupF family hydrogenase formation chaperone [Chloroflexi bacterium]|nr:MAG: HypC/HybG/HupF family hydrogenase formation chaperone [Chloroflexota bacterium]RLC97356.1 MAG: HypC/HybG/HupF family hydrogenase formation chaperone [Chloroflexota bacterium]
MCLAVPALIKSVEGLEAEVDMGGITRRVSLWLTPEAKVGDYVLLHTGYAINVIDQHEAEETLRLLEEMMAAADAEEEE